MLPHEDLEPWYDDLVWMYVCRTWREDDPDREAARIHDRFGITSWPHLLLVDPASGDVIEEAPRALAGLTAAFRRAQKAVAPPPADALAQRDALEAARADWAAGRREAAIAAARDLAASPPDALEVGFEAAEMLRAWTGRDDRTLDDRLGDANPHERIRALEALVQLGDEGDTPARRRLLLEQLRDPAEDPVVRLRALRWLLPRTPDDVFGEAPDLLLQGTDPMRFELLTALRETERPALAPTLGRLVTEAGTSIASGNPNVLRMHAIRALARSGDEASLSTLAPWAQAADPRNVTTREAVAAIAAVGGRLEGTERAEAVRILDASWPAPVPDAEAEPLRARATRMALALVRGIADGLEGLAGVELPPPPAGWSEAERTAWLAAVRAALT